MEKKANLYYQTVSPQLVDILNTLMKSKELSDFRLVGGTALSLLRGHRKSIDIDLFTDSPYGNINFDVIDEFLSKTFSSIEKNSVGEVGMGTSYFVGKNKKDLVKLDLYYTDPFIFPTQIVDNIRMASETEIIAMKMDVILRGGRKKDFWDIHEVIQDYTLKELLSLHKQRYPYAHDKNILVKRFLDFSGADEDFNPNCLRGRHWELIKLDLVDFLKGNGA